MGMVGLATMCQAQTKGLILGHEPIVSQEGRKSLNIYKQEREVLQVVEARMYFKNSAQGDFIMVKPSYNYAVLDRTDPNGWVLELFATEGTDFNQAPVFSAYQTVKNRGTLQENVVEADIRKTTNGGPSWTSLKIIETKDGYIIETGDAHDQWSGKIAKKWICKKGKFAEPARTAHASSSEKDIVIEVDEEEDNSGNKMRGIRFF